MAITIPTMSIGLEIANPCFAIPAATAGVPAAWSASGAGLTSEGVYSAGPFPAHARHQKYSRSSSGSNTITSGLTKPYAAAANVSTEFFYSVLWKASANTAADSWQLTHRFYNSAGGEIAASSNPIAAETGDSTGSDWTLWQFGDTHTPPALTVYQTIELGLTSSTSAAWEFAFAGVGTWPISGGVYGWERLSVFPGTTATRMAKQKIIPTTLGRNRRIDRDRYLQPRRVSLPVQNLSNASKQQIEWAWGMNKGRTWENSSAGNPNGSDYPIMLLPNATGLPKIMLCDFVADEFPLAVGGDFYSDPPVWSGPIDFIERVWG